MPEINVEQLVKTFADQRALDRVSFAVEEGELFTLLGPSGCGKSTTLLSLAGFQSPDEGRIAVAGTTFFDAGGRVNIPAERRNLGIVFQSYAVWPHMTVFENLAFPLKVRRVAKQEIRTRVGDVLELVEMGEYARRYPHQLSGGQQIGTPEEVYRRPANRFVAEFVGRVNLVEGVVTGHDGATVVVAVDGSG